MLVLFRRWLSQDFPAIGNNFLAGIFNGFDLSAVRPLKTKGKIKRCPIL
jgi:hypothetical protein